MNLLAVILALLAAFAAVSGAEQNATTSSDRDILEELYNATNGPEWRRQFGWLNASHHHCDWEGVGCSDQDENVVELRLAANALQGNVTSLGDLRHLILLDFSHNELQGSLQTLGIKNLHMLQFVDLSQNTLDGDLEDFQQLLSLVYLDVSNNLFNGTIGSHFSSLALLEYLNLAGNALTGILDNNLPPNLRSLDVSRNDNLTGTIDMNLTNLERLDMHGNKFHGSIHSLGNLLNLTYLDLSNNDFTGDLTSVASLHQLTSLSLARNGFSGSLFGMANLTLLRELDVSENGNVTGSIGAIATLPNLTNINLAGNQLNGSFSEVDMIWTELQVLDLSRNSFIGELGQLLSGNIMLERLNLAENRFNGSIPDIAFPKLKEANLSFNEFTGDLPTFSEQQLQALERLDLSNQLVSVYDVTTGERITRGISGSIPASIGQAGFLQELRLSNNLISGEIPEELARLRFLQVLDLENNRLSGTIPPSLDLLEQLIAVSLARNELSGSIPELGGSEQVIRVVTLEDNSGLEAPAPFRLCDLEELDLRQDEKYCPLERQALVAFYQATDGDDWNNNENWLAPHAHHCSWFGITCDETNSSVIHVTLPRNGLSGSLPPQFFTLTSIESIDFNDNELRGNVPAEIGELTNLEKLRLSYNIFTGIPDTFQNLTKLSFLHLHGNRIAGSDQYIALVAGTTEAEGHTFISDCGDPVDSLDPFECENCDMCCNSLEECQEPLGGGSLNGYVMALFLIAMVLAVLLALALLLWFLSRKRKRIGLSKTDAREACGEDSVYSFVLANSYSGWIAVFLTVGIQVVTFGLFLNASSFNNEQNDWVYSWRCPRNTEECNDERTLSGYGWAVWALLVFTTLLDDFANSFKLVFLSASRLSIHCFFGSFILLAVTVLAVYTSIVYNRAIAVTNTELIVNAVILLFVNDIDEQMYNAMKVIFPKWVDGLNSQADARSADLMAEDADDNDAKGKGGPSSDRDIFFSCTAEESMLNQQSDSVDEGIIIDDEDPEYSGQGLSLGADDPIHDKLERLERQLTELRSNVEAQRNGRNATFSA